MIVLMIYFESRYESMKTHKNFWLNLVANINTYAVIIETSKSSIKIPHYKTPHITRSTVPNHITLDFRLTIVMYIKNEYVRCCIFTKVTSVSYSISNITTLKRHAKVRNRILSFNKSPYPLQTSYQAYKLSCDTISIISIVCICVPFH